MKDSTLRYNISLEALNLVDGETKRIVCPKCQAQHENSMSITRLGNDYIAFKCWRASCGFKGKIGKGSVSRNLGKTNEDRTKFTPRPFLDPYFSLPPDIERELYHRYGISRELLRTNGVKYCRNRDRLIMPVFDINGDQYGIVAKRWTHGDGEDKVLNHFVKEKVRLHWPKGFSKEHGKCRSIIVEDILSALSLQHYYSTIALLGTELSPEAAEQIRSKTDSIILALDPDATHKAVQIKQRYALLFKEIKIITLPRDPKDCSIEEIQEVLK